jgi:hypothetical protein
MSWLEIRVRCCDYCGEHATQTEPDDESVRQTFTVEGFELDQCDQCGLIACHSCLSNRDCCEHAENQTRMAKRNGKLF